MWGWAWVNFSADIETIVFNIDKDLNVYKKEGWDLSNLVISWYNEWDLDVDYYFNNFYWKDTSYESFFNKNIEIKVNKDDFKDWISIAKDQIIENINDHIKDYINNLLNVNVYHTSWFNDYTNKEIIHYGIVDKDKFNIAENFIKKFWWEFDLLANEQLVNEYKLYLIGSGETQDVVNNMSKDDLLKNLIIKYKKLLGNAKLNSEEYDKKYDKEYKKIVKYIKDKLDFIEFDWEMDVNDWKIENMFWAWYVRWKLEEWNNLFYIDINDINITWNSTFNFNLDTSDKLIKKIYDKEYHEFQVSANDMYNLLEESKKEWQNNIVTELDDLFNIEISYEIKKDFVNFYYNVFENDSDNDVDTD